jgi:hypothetical protein
MTHARDFQETVSATGFAASLVAYGAFAFAEAMSPGFVSRFFSIHLFLLAALAFGAWQLVVTKRYEEWVVLQYFAAILAGPAAAYLTWKLGDGFGDFRLLAALVASLVPLSVLLLARNSSAV